MMEGGLGWVDRGFPKMVNGEARSGLLSALGSKGRGMGLGYGKLDTEQESIPIPTPVQTMI